VQISFSQIKYSNTNFKYRKFARNTIAQKAAHRMLVRWQLKFGLEEEEEKEKELYLTTWQRSSSKGSFLLSLWSHKKRLVRLLVNNKHLSVLCLWEVPCTQGQLSLKRMVHSNNTWHFEALFFPFCCFHYKNN